MTKNSVSAIRDSWVSIFSFYGYSPLPAFSLVPSENDKSLLFINSGVAALKEKFKVIGNSAESYNAVNCQPVIRTDDIDRLEFSSCHQTMFEMLGSFSVSGKFKKDVIPIVWEWLTSEKWLFLPKTNLFVTVWDGDEESFQIWKEILPSERNIFFGNKNTNFWDMGDGPCGPNTEVYYNLTPENDNQSFPSSIKDLESKNFVEIGNIVFPQFNHQGDLYKPLEQKCVDIGMGLERIAMIKQNKKDVFLIDIWEPVIKELLD